MYQLYLLSTRMNTSGIFTHSLQLALYNYTERHLSFVGTSCSKWPVWVVPIVVHVAEICWSAQDANTSMTPVWSQKLESQTPIPLTLDGTLLCWCLCRWGGGGGGDFQWIPTVQLVCIHEILTPHTLRCTSVHIVQYSNVSTTTCKSERGGANRK